MRLVRTHPETWPCDSDPPDVTGSLVALTWFTSGGSPSGQALRGRPILLRALETLEARVVLSTSTITIAGTMDDNTFLLAASGSDLVATVNGTTTTYAGALASASGVEQIQVEGGTGNNGLTVDSTCGYSSRFRSPTTAAGVKITRSTPERRHLTTGRTRYAPALSLAQEQPDHRRRRHPDHQLREPGTGVRHRTRAMTVTGTSGDDAISYPRAQPTRPTRAWSRSIIKKRSSSATRPP